MITRWKVDYRNLGSKHKFEKKKRGLKKSSWEFVGELSNTTCVLDYEKQGHEKKWGVQKGCKKGTMALFPRARVLSSLARLSHALSPSYGPVMQARNRLEMGGVGEALSYWF